MKTSQLNSRVSSELRDRIRNTVAALEGPPLHMSLRKLVEEGLEWVVGEYEIRENGGDRFPESPGDLRRGRRVAKGGEE